MASTSASSASANSDQPSEKPRGGSVFVNQGLINFERKRAAWLSGGSEGGSNGSNSSSNISGEVGGGRALGATEVRAKNVDVEDVVDKIFSQTGDGRLPQPIPLGQMIDILVEFWEADGLYD